MPPALRLPTLALTAAIACAGLAGCDGSGSDGPGGDGTRSADTRLDDALGDLPAAATTVEFVDRVAIAEQYGVADVGPTASESERTAYVDALADAPVGTELSTYVLQMDRAAFSELDLEWQATATGPDDLYAQLWRVRDDLDLDAVGDDLVQAGYTRSGSDAAPRFTADVAGIDAATNLIDGRYPPSLLDVTLLPDAHLVVTGPSADAVAATVAGADSVADGGAFDDVLGHADTSDALEFVSLRRGDDTCGPPAAAGPDSEEAADSDAELGTPVASGWFSTGSGDDHGVLLFDDDAAAGTDADQRETYLADFDEFYGLDIDFEVSQDGDAVLVASDAAEARTTISATQRREGPLACTPA